MTGKRGQSGSLARRRRAWIETPSRRDQPVISPLDIVAVERDHGVSEYYAVPMPERWICSFMDRLTGEVLERYPQARAVYRAGSLWGSGTSAKSRAAAGLGDNGEGDDSRRRRIALLFEHQGQPYGYLKLGTGAPIAAAGLERLIALGAKQIIVTGTVGVLDPEIRRGELILASRAIREEGTSYHYLPAARYVHPSRSLMTTLRQALAAMSYPHRVGTTWTTDAFYRETRQKIATLRSRDRAMCVEMEAAALFAVGRFRRVHVAGLFYASDAVGGESWDFRNHDGGRVRHSRTVLLDIALKAFELAQASEAEGTGPR